MTSQTVLFLIDNSASMNQRCYLGTTLLDVAKGAVETFIKQRANRTDKYLLVTFDDLPNSIKVGWKECQNHGVILNRLKSIRADGLTTFGQALKLSFDILSVNRHLTGIDTYGQGRSPFFLEPSMIVAITDGGKLSNRSAVFNELHLPMTNALPGSELTKEPFRWDQRLFSLVLRLPANATKEPEQLGSVPSDLSPISLMCEVTGGRSYSIKTHKTLLQCLDSLLQKVQSGVVVHFERDPACDKDVLTKKSAFPSSVLGEPLGKHSPAYNSDFGDSHVKANDAPLWHSLHRMIYVRPNAKSGLPFGHWPLPESYCPDHNAPTLPPRNAHPVLRFRTEDVEPVLLQNFPYDKYELEPSPLTQVLLEKKNAGICWVVYVENSGKQTGISHPCGYLKASSNLTCVNLFVMPYNYPVILPLIEQLIKQKMKPSMEWRRMFDEYLKMLPPYYFTPFRKSLKQIAAPNLISDNFNAGLSYSVTVYFKKLKEQTKVAADRFQAAADVPNNKGVLVQPRYSSVSVTQLPNFQRLLASITGDDVLPGMVEVNDFPGFCIGRPDAKKKLLPREYHNPFDISRRDLLSQLRKMRLNFKQVVQSSFAKAVGSSVERAFRIRLQDRVEVHNQPISQMGNYQEYAKAQTPPLREANPDAPRRLHTFGNPFKLAKEKGIMIDETEDYDGPSDTSGTKGKRKSSMDHSGFSNKRKRSSSRSPSRFIWKKADKPATPSKPTVPDANQNINKEKDSASEEPAALVVPPKVEKLDTEPSKDIFDDSDDNIFERLLSVDTFEETVSDEPQKPDITTIEVSNNNVASKTLVFKLIRTPGRHTAEVTRELSKITGSIAAKQRLIESLIVEGQRFKRHSLVAIFENFAENLKRSSTVIESLGASQ